MIIEQEIPEEFIKRLCENYTIRKMRLVLNPCQTEGHRYNDQSTCVVCGSGMRDVTPPDRDAT